MLSLRATTQDHHAKLLPHVDRLLDLAEMIGQVDCSAIHDMFDTEYAFVVGQLVPHIEAIENTLYGQLEQLLDHRHSMAPMRQEHVVMRQLIDELGGYRSHAERCAVRPARLVAPRESRVHGVAPR